MINSMHVYTTMAYSVVKGNNTQGYINYHYMLYAKTSLGYSLLNQHYAWVHWLRLLFKQRLQYGDMQIVYCRKR